jgi:gamma-glutamyl hercynylcysteine S-oxide synthase
MYVCVFLGCCRTEEEWEVACSGSAVLAEDGTWVLEAHKTRTFPWGDGLPNTERANCGLRLARLLDVTELPESDSFFGVRQMIGNVWEWTSSSFLPYPGFIIDFPYKDNSAPFFGDKVKVARGGCFATADEVLLCGGAYRSFYHVTDRPELCVGFRTCALQ